jgi:iron complex outermembrane receptor protein
MTDVRRPPSAVLACASAALLLGCGAPARAADAPSTPGGAAQGASDVTAATAPAAPGADPGADVLAEIVVTAQRRPERLYDVPISIAVVGREALQAIGASDISEAAQFAPNVSFDNVVAQSGGTLASSIYVRGIGQSDFLQTTDPGVGLFVDGVYLARAVGSVLDAAEVERVEVLRGPQGTLFGRNTIGGAINVTLQPPGDALALLGRVTTGSDDRLDGYLRLDAPVGERVRTRWSFASFDQDGYVVRPAVGDALGDRNARVARGAVVYEPSERFKASFAADYTRRRESGVPAALVRVAQTCPRGTTSAIGGCDAFAATPGQSYLFNNVPPVNRAAGGAGVGRSVYDRRYVSGDPYVNFGTGPEEAELDLWGASVTLDAKLGSVGLRSITAWRTFDAWFVRDTDASPFTIVVPSSTVEQRQFTQELQLLGTSFDDRLDWVGGLYFFDENADDDSDFQTASFVTQSGGVDIGGRAHAPFAQGTWRFTPRLALTAGARYTEERRTYTPTQFFVSSVTGMPPAGLVVVPRVENRLSFSKPTWRVALETKPVEDALVYLSWATGFKAGGFVQRNQVPRPTLPTFGPETVEVVELGAKATAFDRRLSASVAVFSGDYEDLHIRIIEPVSFSPVTSNAGDARIRGAELEFDAALHPRVRLNGAFGWLDAGYRRIAPTVPDVTLRSKLTDTPEWSGNLGLVGTLPLTSGTLSGRVDWIYRSEHYNDAENTPELRQGAFGLLNLSASWRAVAGAWSWSVTGGVRNATDERYVVSGYSLAAQGPVGAAYARPREWFVTLEAGF